MPRTALAAQAVTDAGLDPAYTAANVDGHSIPPGALLHVKNGGGASINVTLQTPVTFQGKAVADTVVAVPAGAERIIGGLKPTLYGDSVLVDFSGVTTVTVAAFTA